MSSSSSIDSRPTGSRVSRRDALASFGGMALAHLLARDSSAAEGPRPEFDGGVHHRARAKRVVQLFMSGAASQVDTFD
jgi:hypothetical protein